MSGRIIKIIRILAPLVLITACQAARAVPTNAPQPILENQAPSATPVPTAAPTATLPPAPTPTHAVELRAPVWTFQTEGAVWSSPAVVDGLVYFGSDDHTIYAVDAQSGELKWKFATAGLVRSRPAVGEGRLYAASDDGNLYALEAATGNELWKTDIGNAAAPRLHPAGDYDWDYLQSSPRLSGDAVYVGSVDGHLYALEAATGKEIWKFQTGDRVRSSPAAADGVVYVGSWDGYIYAVDESTGKEKWKFSARGQWNPVQPSPLVVGNTVYVGSRSHREFAIDVQTGKEKWNYQYVQGWVESSAALANGVIYVGSSEDRALYAIDSSTGKLHWQFRAGGVVFSSPAVEHGVVYAGTAHWDSSMGHYFYALDIAAGEKVIRMLPEHARWRVEIGETLDKAPVSLHGIVSSPAISGDMVYFGGLDGKLYAVSTK